METIKEELGNKKYISAIILQIYNQMVEHGSGKGNRPINLVIGKKELEMLRKLNLDWQRDNSNSTTLMGFELEVMDELPINKIKLI